jgi:hypothetical protein
MSDAETPLEREKINQETSQILWAELQRFFASGLAIQVDTSLDLVDVAWHFAKDDKSQVEQWLNQNKVGPVADSQAQQWLDDDALVWAVVIKPWILVQETAD